MTASRHAQPIAEFRAAFIPPRTASAPPVKNPAITNIVNLVSLSKVLFVYFVLVFDRAYPQKYLLIFGLLVSLLMNIGLKNKNLLAL